MQPEELVKILAADAKPVRRLSSPMMRLLIWLGISIAYAAIVVWLMGLRPDILSKLGDARFVVELSATFMTSVLAAAAAFCAGCPGRPIWERFAPLPALGLCREWRRRAFFSDRFRMLTQHPIGRNPARCSYPEDDTPRRPDSSHHDDGPGNACSGRARCDSVATVP
jgi:hypothetical protein